eukprot:66971_1
MTTPSFNGDQEGISSANQDYIHSNDHSNSSLQITIEGQTRRVRYSPPPPPPGVSNDLDQYVFNDDEYEDINNDPDLSKKRMMNQSHQRRTKRAKTNQPQGSKVNPILIEEEGSKIDPICIIDHSESESESDDPLVSPVYPDFDEEMTEINCDFGKLEIKFNDDNESMDMLTTLNTKYNIKLETLSALSMPKSFFFRLLEAIRTTSATQNIEIETTPLSINYEQKLLYLAITVLEAMELRMASDGPPQEVKSQVMIISPRRHMAVQMHHLLEKLTKMYATCAVNLIGGLGNVKLRAALKCMQRGVDIVTGTPGLLSDAVRKHEMTRAMCSEVILLALDGAEKLKEESFIEDMIKIATALPNRKIRVISLESVNFDNDQEEYNHLHQDITYIKHDNAHEDTMKRLKEISHVVLSGCFRSSRAKIIPLMDIISKFPQKKIIIFTNQKNKIIEIYKELQSSTLSRNIMMLDKHSSNSDRMRIISIFQKPSPQHMDSILICTDIVSVGVDLDVCLIINFDIPHFKYKPMTTYIERCGVSKRHSVWVINIVHSHRARYRNERRSLSLDEQRMDDIGRKFEIEYVDYHEFSSMLFSNNRPSHLYTRNIHAQQNTDDVTS